MHTEIDPYAVHYFVLGLPSGAGEMEIKTAYKSKALKLHPDKNLNDPNAQANFQKLRASFEILTKAIEDEKAREEEKARKEKAKLQRQTRLDSKRQRLVSDLEKREQRAYHDPVLRAKAEEDERITRTLQEEINRIRSRFTQKGPDVPASKKIGTSGGGAQSSNLGKGTALDQEKVLMVSWEKTGVDYGVERLKDIFSNFGIVEYVVIKSSKKKGSAVVVMATRDAAVAAIGNVLGDISNPLLVLPLQPTQSPASPLFPRAPRNLEPSYSNLSNLVGCGHQAFENSVLEKMKKAAQKQK